MNQFGYNKLKICGPYLGSPPSNNFGYNHLNKLFTDYKIEKNFETVQLSKNKIDCTTVFLPPAISSQHLNYAQLLNLKVSLLHIIHH